MKIRAWFQKGERLRYVAHLDLLRAWERAIRRAGLPLSYSQGFTPHPRIAFSSPLPMGFLADCEVLDITLDERVEVEAFLERVGAQLSEGLAVVRATEIPLQSPAPQATMRWADYRADLDGVDPALATEMVARFMAAAEWPWTERRHDKERRYDLRETVVFLRLGKRACGVSLEMRLRADPEQTGRPEQVVAALFPGNEGAVFTRTAVLLDEPSPAREAWRRKGQYE